MTSQIVSPFTATRGSSGWLFRGFSILAVMTMLSGLLLAQTDPNAAGGDNAGRNRARRGQNAGGDANGAGGGGRGNFDPAQFQQRMMDQLREQFDVTDDAEWKVIVDRVTAVNELRLSTRGGFGGLGGFRGAQAGQGGQAGGARPGRGGATTPEVDALRQAITDKLPDAEIKSRLDRVREVRKANEEKLTKAQEELRAVLSVRQEAVAVMAGLLP